MPKKKQKPTSEPDNKKNKLTEEQIAIQNEPTPFVDPKDQVIAQTYKQMAVSFRNLSKRIENLEHEKSGLKTIWQKLWRTMIVTHHIPKERFKNGAKLQGSIYPFKDQTVKGYTKKFRWIHYVFKYKMFVPWLILCDWVLGKYCEDKIEDVWYNKNMKIWDDSWKKTMEILGKFYNPSFSNKKKGSYLSYNTIRRLWNTLVQNDTATKEFQNVFMHELTKNMNKAYKGHKQVYHVFYTGSTSYEPVYFTFAQAVMTQNKHPSEVMKQSQDDLSKRAKEVLKQPPVKKGTTKYVLYKMCESCKQLNHIDTQYCSKCGKLMLGGVENPNNRQENQVSTEKDIKGKANDKSVKA